MAKSSLEAIGADTDQWIPYLHKEAELGNTDAMAYSQSNVSKRRRR